MKHKQLLLSFLLLLLIAFASFASSSSSPPEEEEDVMMIRKLSFGAREEDFSRRRREDEEKLVVAVDRKILLPTATTTTKTTTTSKGKEEEVKKNTTSESNIIAVAGLLLESFSKFSIDRCFSSSSNASSNCSSELLPLCTLMMNTDSADQHQQNADVKKLLATFCGKYFDFSAESKVAVLKHSKFLSSGLMDSCVTDTAKLSLTCKDILSFNNSGVKYITFSSCKKCKLGLGIELSLFGPIFEILNLAKVHRFSSDFSVLNSVNGKTLCMSQFVGKINGFDFCLNFNNLALAGPNALLFNLGLVLRVPFVGQFQLAITPFTLGTLQDNKPVRRKLLWHYFVLFCITMHCSKVFVLEDMCNFFS